MKIRELFATRLKELMCEHSLSCRKLASEVGLSNQAISSWLNCKRSPVLENLWVLSSYFDCTVDYLIGKSEY